MFQLGPHYMGSFLAPNPAVDPVQLVSEEKVVFGLNAKAVSHLTLNKIRKVYSRADNKSIGKNFKHPTFITVNDILVSVIRMYCNKHIY